MIKSLHQYLLPLLLCFNLVACNSSDNDNSAPTINSYQKDIFLTGALQNVGDWQWIHNTTISAEVIDDGTIEDYQWEILSDQNLEFRGLNDSEFSFSYPTTLTEEPNILIFDLTVTDNKGSSSLKKFEYDLNDFVDITMPAIYGKPNQLLTVTPVISGKRSKIISYRWLEHPGINIELFNMNDETLEAQFYAPDVDEPTSYYFLLEFLMEADGSDKQSIEEVSIGVYIEP